MPTADETHLQASRKLQRQTRPTPSLGRIPSALQAIAEVDRLRSSAVGATTTLEAVYEFALILQGSLFQLLGHQVVALAPLVFDEFLGCKLEPSIVAPLMIAEQGFHQVA